MNPPAQACHYCGSTEADMRPYGPSGSLVCFPCATETPERKAICDANMEAAIAGMGQLGLIAIMHVRTMIQGKTCRLCAGPLREHQADDIVGAGGKEYAHGACYRSATPEALADLRTTSAKAKPR